MEEIRIDKVGTTPGIRPGIVHRPRLCRVIDNYGAICKMADESNYRRPPRLGVHLLDPLTRFMIRRRLAPGGNSGDGGGMRILEVRGRQTGRWYQRPVFVAAVGRVRVIVSMRGESPWARNLRAPTADAHLRFGTRLEPVEACELKDGDGKAAVILALCRQNPSFARFNFKVDPQRVTLEQAQRLADRYPVFRIETRARGAVLGGPPGVRAMGSPVHDTLRQVTDAGRSDTTRPR